nr:MAG TPA: hypothetical protein [Caudoviricetes sp.]
MEDLYRRGDHALRGMARKGRKTICRRRSAGCHG